MSVALKPARHHPALTVLAFPVTLLVLGTLWSAIDVYALDNWDGKFGRWGTFKLGVQINGVASAVACVGSVIAIYGLRALFRGWDVRRPVLLSCLAAVITITTLRYTHLWLNLADPMVVLLGSHFGDQIGEFTELGVYLMVLGTLQCSLITVIFFLAWVFDKRLGSFDI